jgi:hypothetical protein
MIKNLVAGMLLVLASLSVGCSSSPAPVRRAEAPAPQARPNDFTLAMSVYAPAGTQESKLPRSLKPGRYVLEPDGALRGGSGAKAPAYPPIARQLTPEQMDQIWRLVRDSELLDPDNPARVDDPSAISVSPDRVMATVYLAAAGTRRSLRVLMDRGSPTAMAAEQLADRLAEMAWVR